MLVRLNDRWSKPASGWCLTVFVLVGSTLFSLLHMQRDKVLHQPPELAVDAFDYDLIAWGIATGRGFVRDSRSTEFQQPYLARNPSLKFTSIAGPATDRPPLYPVLLAATFWAGRQFQLIRIIQALFLGLVATAVAQRVMRCAGLIPALLSMGLFLIVDPRPRTMTSEILTESMSCMLVMVLYLVLISWDSQQRTRDVLIAGFVFGLLVLCRSMMILWLPVLGIWTWRLKGRLPRWSIAKPFFIFVSVTVAVCLPWWIRNVQVLGEFRPLGSQGAEQLSAAYSDGAFSRMGMWFSLDATGFFEENNDIDPVKRILARVNHSEQQAKRWVCQHPFKAAALWPLRILQEFRPHGPGDLFILAFATLGLAILWRTPDGRIARWLIAAQMLAVASTWSVAGRFVFPLLGVLHVLAAVGVWGSYVTIVERRALSRLWILAESEAL